MRSRSRAARAQRAAQQQPEEKRRGFRLRPAYIVVILIMAFFAMKFLQETQKVRLLAAEHAALQYQNEKTAQQNAQLARAIRYYKTPQFIREDARAMLDYTLPGDIAIQTQPRPQRVVVRPAPVAAPAPAQPTWKLWWHAFFGT